MTADSRIADHFEKYRKLMDIDEAVAIAAASRGKMVQHAARQMPVTLKEPPDRRHAGGGPADLTDGELGSADKWWTHWLGFRGTDLEATVDMGRPVAVRGLSVRFLQTAAMGVYLPGQVQWSVSDDGWTFRPIAVMKHDVPLGNKGPLVKRFAAELSDVKARYVRVWAANIGMIPPKSPGAGRPAWMFVDEITVEREP